MSNADLEDRRATLDAFAATPHREHNVLAPAGAFSAPAERVFGAQPVAVRRDEQQILAKLRTLAAAAGESWYYRYPVRKKIKDENTGRIVGDRLYRGPEHQARERSGEIIRQSRH